MVLLSTQNICLNIQIKKYLQFYDQFLFGLSRFMATIIDGPVSKFLATQTKPSAILADHFSS